jgi:hypothetical protein
MNGKREALFVKRIWAIVLAARDVNGLKTRVGDKTMRNRA